MNGARSPRSEAVQTLRTVAPWLALLLLAAGCTTLGPPYAPEDPEASPPGTAAVYAYRPPRILGGAVPIRLHVEDRALPTLRPGDYLLVHVSAGPHELWASTETRAQVTLDAKEGMAYYLRAEIGVGVLQGRPQLQWVEQPIAEQEIQGSPRVWTDVPDADSTPGPGASTQQPRQLAAAVAVILSPEDLEAQPGEQGGPVVRVHDHRGHRELARTTLGVPMGAVVLQPEETRIVAALVTSRLGKALAARGLDPAASPVDCDLEAFSVTTPGTALYWDISVHLKWVLRTARASRSVEVRSTRRTYLWPSQALIRQTTLAALKAAASRTGELLPSLLDAPPPQAQD